ncbi:sugar fermentation stimulation protein A [Ectothiorhodospira magna]|uniref:Sugar fermentation stimulation protein homolog n=1 Tax=Ectothiorhodospira magna TaxID=867345 RepID=A0A1H9AQJ7_9GAMM|nr:DNA/RNA nuclease SfsA [Ectothiorhodospira magna]SEP78653.1 sugar fermentation stimulation protein A [Ectothiorhodospira magna]
MIFSQPLIPGKLQRRYKRFLADVLMDDGEILTAHCPNTGAMLGCMTPGSRVWLSRSDDPRRKYPHTWEMVEADGVMVGIHTGRSNALVEEAIRAGRVPELAGFTQLRREVSYGQHNSRIDLLLHLEGRDCYVEVKNVTAAVQGGVALFPDAVSSRASKHLRELMAMVEAGHRAMLIFCVQREDVQCVRPADSIDPEYGMWLRRARDAGVETLALGAQVSPDRIELIRPLPVDM